MTTPYPAHCLVVPRDEANREHPGRDKRSDGWLGDPRHFATGRPEAGGSKHNPNAHGAVDARDFDNSALDVARFVACAIRHPSTRNVIYNRKIRSKGYRGGLAVAYAYHGPSPHTEHVHVDIEMTVSQENDGRAWGYYRGGSPVVTIPVKESTTTKPATPKPSPAGMTRMPTLRRTNTVLAATRTLQRALRKLGYQVGPADGKFGPATWRAVRALQGKAGLKADGIVGPRTWVAILQALLRKALGSTLSVDGELGLKTGAAIVAFQKKAKIKADGIAGPVTIAALII